MAPSTWTPRAFEWEVAPPAAGAAELGRALRIPALVAQVLHNRGIDTPDAARAFLDPQLNDLHDPQMLGGSAAAARRIARAVAEKQRIVLYGDYDVDGMTGVAILHACLTMVGADVDYYVPHRLDEGYGVNAEAVRGLLDDGAQLLITVDCGVGAVEPIARAVAAGADVIVTDHHAPPRTLPDACAIVHPRIPEGQYPNPDLAGAGVAFKLAWAVAREICGNDKVDEAMRTFLLDATCLAALGTIADIVPLVGENRVLAAFGLRGLLGTRHPGIRALLESASLTGERVDAYHVGFVLGPRLNAAGRMGHARLAVELLTGAAPHRCAEIAEYLAKQNTQRQRVQREIAGQAEQMVRDNRLDAPDRRILVLASDQWHGGVIGIVASRMVNLFHRPALLIAINGDGLGQGSGRSIPGFDLRAALDACSEHLIGFGGHAMAAGLKIRPDRIDAFADAMNAHAATVLTDRDLAAKLPIDAETTVDALDYTTVQQLHKLAPFGKGNPSPLVALRNCQIRTAPKRIGRTGQTVTFHLAQGRAGLRAVGFGMGDLADLLAGVKKIDVAGEPILNTFNGRTSVELKLKDVLWK